MKKILLLLLIAFSYTSIAQTVDSTFYKWTPKGVAGFNISQVALSNWTQGGDNSISYSLAGNFGLNYKAESWKFKNNLKLVYGQTKLGDDDFKTNENELYLESVYSRQLGWAVDPYVSNTIRTSIVDGYNYENNTSTRIAGFFDPGYVTQSIGFTYDKEGAFKSRLGLAFQETFTNRFRQYSDDPDTPDEMEAFKFETGIESVTDISWGFMENMLFNSKLRLFTRFDMLDVWDVRWDNSITAQVNKYINVNLNVLIIYEKSQSLKTQMKEALQLGITYNLF